MAIFVVGDIHGQYKRLNQWLALVDFDPQKDTLWCTGDLVNRGKKSLEVMQFCHALGGRFMTVLGNHDVFLLALYHGYQTTKSIPKCLDRILQHTQADILMNWLSQQPFYHYHQPSQIILTHAGIPPFSSMEENLQANKKLQHLFQASEKKAILKDFLSHHMMGNEPRYTTDIQNSYDYYRYFINCYTRMRYCDHTGAPRYGFKGKPTKAPATHVPWFDLQHHHILSFTDPRYCVLFGHWATLYQQPIASEYIFPLDDACAWGGCLKGLCLEGCEHRGYHKKQFFSVSCA